MPRPRYLILIAAAVATALLVVPRVTSDPPTPKPPAPAENTLAPEQFIEITALAEKLTVVRAELQAALVDENLEPEEAVKAWNPLKLNPASIDALAAVIEGKEAVPAYWSLRDLVLTYRIAVRDEIPVAARISLSLAKAVENQLGADIRIRAIAEEKGVPHRSSFASVGEDETLGLQLGLPEVVSDGDGNPDAHDE